MLGARLFLGVGGGGVTEANKGGCRSGSDRGERVRGREGRDGCGIY